MEQARTDGAGHEQHRVLSIRGKAACDSACVFCVEKFTPDHPLAPKSDQTRELIVQGAGKYNMLFFMNGEPTLSAKLFEHVELAKSLGYRYFGMSSHFRRFANPTFALKTLEAGFEFFDVSLHAATYEAQERVNPIGDGGQSLKEALHGVRNILEIARRTGRRAAITHKIVITRMNHRDLPAIFRVTYRLGVRNYIIQPVKVSGLDGDRPSELGIGEDEFMPFVNEFLRSVEGSGAEIKLYGMSQLGAYQSRDLVQESNVIKHAYGRTRDGRRSLPMVGGDRLIPERLPSATGALRRITIRLPGSEAASTFDCAEDQYVLNAALASGLPLPFGCRMGSCGMCCVRILDGSLDQSEQLVLTSEQVADGFAVICRSKPRSDLVLLADQESALGI